MKKLLLITVCLFASINSFSQYSSVSFIVLNEGMEKAYLDVERVWSEYHKEAVKNGQKSAWMIWKIVNFKAEDNISKDRYPNYLIIENYSSKKQLEEEWDRYSGEGMKKIIGIIKEKSNLSNRQIDKILSKNTRKETRVYLHEILASTPFTGGSLKPGDKMTMTAMEQLSDDYEQFETEFYKDVFLNNIMEGNHRFWGFTKITDRSDNAFDFPTHVTWNLGFDEKNLKFPEDFVSNKILEITPNVRKAYNPVNLTLVYIAE